MRIKNGIYQENINPDVKIKLIGLLRLKMAIRLEKSDKAQMQAEKDIYWMRIKRSA